MGVNSGSKGVTTEDQWERRRRDGVVPWNQGLRYLAKALIPGTKRYKSKAFATMAEALKWADG